MSVLTPTFDDFLMISGTVSTPFPPLRQSESRILRPYISRMPLPVLQVVFISIFPSSIATINDIGLNTEPGSIILVTARGSISAYPPFSKRESDEMALIFPVCTSIKMHIPALAPIERS